MLYVVIGCLFVVGVFALIVRMLTLAERENQGPLCPACGCDDVAVVGDGWGGSLLECGFCRATWSRKRSEDDLPPPAVT